MNHSISEHDRVPKPFWRTRYAAGLLVMSAIAAYLLLSEHRAHFIFALPFLLLLACPLMHVFMHHGHSGNANRHTDDLDGSHSSAGNSAPHKARK